MAVVGDDVVGVHSEDECPAKRVKLDRPTSPSFAAATRTPLGSSCCNNQCVSSSASFFEIVDPSMESTHEQPSFLIPKAFITRFLSYLGSSMQLESPGGRLWAVQLEADSSDRLRITTGWKEFACYMEAQSGDLMIFDLVSRCHFKVYIYEGEDSCEKAISFKSMLAKDKEQRKIDDVSNGKHDHTEEAAAAAIPNPCEPISKQPELPKIHGENPIIDSQNKNKEAATAEAAAISNPCEPTMSKPSGEAYCENSTTSAQNKDKEAAGAASIHNPCVPELPQVYCEISTTDSQHKDNEEAASAARPIPCESMSDLPAHREEPTTDRRKKDEKGRIRETSHDKGTATAMPNTCSYEPVAKELPEVSGENPTPDSQNEGIHAEEEPKPEMQKADDENASAGSQEKRGGRVEEGDGRMGGFGNAGRGVGMSFSSGSSTGEARLNKNQLSRDGFWKIWRHFHAETQEAFKNALDFSSTNPFTILLMIRSNVCFGFKLCFPRVFARKHLSGVPQEVALLDKDNKAWAVTWLGRQNGDFSLSGGWRYFALDHALKPGDICIFEFIRMDAIMAFRVHIYRVSPADATAIGHTLPSKFSKVLGKV